MSSLSLLDRFDTPLPLEQSPQDSPYLLFKHSLLTAAYRDTRRIQDSQGRRILDIGCGSGYKALTLAIANPGAHIVGIDISETSIQRSQERFQHHGLDTGEFRVLSIEALPSLGMQFDYINCDEVLYLLPDPVAALQTMKSVLAPGGYIRANLHSIYQRRGYYQSQQIFRMLGLMDNPQEMEVEMVRETMQSLKDNTFIKRVTWNPIHEEKATAVLSDYLLADDKGYTLPDLFAMLEAADLRFVSMVNWQQWEFLSLFQNPDALPDFWQKNLSRFTPQQQLRFYELLNPIHRTLDFWCTHPTSEPPPAKHDIPTRIHLHPVLQTEAVRSAIAQSYAMATPFDFTQHLPLPNTAPLVIESTVAASLLPLWESPQPFATLVERYRQLHPLDPTTLEPMTAAAITHQFTTILAPLETHQILLYE